MLSYTAARRGGAKESFRRLASFRPRPEVRFGARGQEDRKEWNSQVEIHFSHPSKEVER